MASRTITIFLASSEELKNDRNSFSDLIRSLDDIYEERGIRIKLRRWENFFAYCTDERTQDDYNRVLGGSDMCICLFHKKAGKYTVEEFHHAMDQYRQTGDHPKTYVYARALVEGEIEEDELKQFKDELFKQMGHYWCNYATEDSMKLHFVMQFERLMNTHIGQDGSSSLSVEQGNVLLHGHKVADYANIPFAANNDEVKALKDKIASLNQDIVTMTSCGVDVLQPMINEKRAQRNKYQEQLEQLEQQLLETALSISKMIGSGNPISERKRAAIEMFEHGNNKGVLEMLNEQDIERDYQVAKSELASGKQLSKAAEQMIASAQTKIRSLVEEYILKADTWMSTYSEENRFEEACKLHEKAIALVRESLPENELAESLYNYGCFLQKNNQYHLVEVYYKEAVEIYRNLSEAQLSYLQDVADILNNLGGICFQADRLDEALKYYHEASEIYEKIKEEDPSSYYKKNLMVLYNLANVYMDMNMLPGAEVLHTTVCSMRKQLAQENPYVYTEPLADSATALARLYQKTQRYKEAENSQMAALKLRRYLVKNRTDRVQEYQLDLSTTLGDLANIYQKTNRYQEAEEYYNEALAIRRKLSQEHPQAYMWALASTLMSMGALYKDMGRFTQAEEYYQQALQIYQELALANPNVYMRSVASVWNSLAMLCRAMERREEAKGYYLQALETRQKLAATNPKQYLGAVADVQENLAILYQESRQFLEAETNYLEVLDIRQDLAHENPKVYLPYLATCQQNIAVMYQSMLRMDEAEEYYLQALETRQELAKDNPQVYQSEVAFTMNNLAFLYVNTARYEEALEYYSQVLDMRYQLAEKNPQVYLPAVANTVFGMAQLYLRWQQFEESEEYYQLALGLYQQLYDENPQVYAAELSLTLNGLALLYTNTEDADKHKEAEGYLLQSLAIRRDLVKDNPEVHLPELAMILNNLALLYTFAENPQWDEAEKLHLEAIAIRLELAEKYPDVYQPQVATSQMTLGGLYCMTKQYEQAEEYYKLALKNFEQAAEENLSTFMQPLAQTLAALGMLYTETNRPALAKEYFEKASDMFSAMDEKLPGLFKSDIEELKVELEKLN